MKTKYILRPFIILLFILTSLTSKAQNTIYATAITDSSSDFRNAYRAADASMNNYAYLSNVLTLLSTSYLQASFPQSGRAGDAINITVSGTGSLLSTSLLNSITVKLYDAAGRNVANGSGSSLLQLYLLSSGTGTYAIRFQTNPTDTYSYKQVRIEFNNILSVSLLNEFKVYNIFYQQPCPAVLANNVYAFGTNSLLTGFVNNAGNAVDTSASNYATMNVPLNLLGLLPPAYLDLSFSQYGRGGDYVGFTIADGSSLLSLGVLNRLTIDVYSNTGSLIASKSGFTLADLKLLAGSSGKYMLGFVTPKSNSKIARVKLTMTATLGLLEDIHVYNAFHFNSNRQPITVVASGSLNLCPGGSVTLTAVDSSGGNNFLWSNGATTSSITVTTGGTYTVEVMDSASCSRTSIPVVVMATNPATATIIGDTVLCSNSGGNLHTSAAYSGYQWSNGSTATSISITRPGKYYVSVTDSNGCSQSDSAIVTTDNLDIAANITSPSCANSSDGSIALAISSGSGSYSYVWNNGNTANPQSSLQSGLYTVFVRDNAYNCIFPRTFTLQSKNDLAVTSSIVNTTGAGNTDGYIMVTTIGGSGSYSYLWSNGAMSSSVSGLAAGVYYLRITDNTNGCVLLDTLQLQDGNNPLTIAISVTNNATCNANNGQLTASISGGSGSYSYLWSNGATTPTITGLAAGTYYLTVRDNNTNYVMTAMAPVINNSFVINGSTTNATCGDNNGAINIAVTGGSGSYSYLWNNGAVTSNISGLQAGTYILTVFDLVRGCTQQQVFNVGQSGGPSATLSVTQPQCSSNSNGSITVVAAGSNNSYKWSTGATTQNISGLSAGTYVLTITDTTSGCSSTYSATLNAPDQLDIVATKHDNSSCATAPNGNVSVIVSGGIAPYTYSWSNGTTAPVLTSLRAGSYLINVRDNGGCSDSLRITVADDTANMLHIIIDSSRAASCYTSANGHAGVHATCGTVPYTYLWSDGSTGAIDLHATAGSYSVTATDAAGCNVVTGVTITADTATAVMLVTDSVTMASCSSTGTGKIYTHALRGVTPYTFLWSNGSTTANITGLTGGTYAEIVTDAVDCRDTAMISVPNSGSLAATVDSNVSASCSSVANGRVVISASGGTAPYTYSWSTGATMRVISGLGTGTYNVTVSDAGGCTSVLPVIVSADTAKAVHVIIDSVIAVNCMSISSGKIYAHAERGIIPYSYLWNTGATTNVITNATVGSYSITATDAVGCKSTASATVAHTDNPVVAVGVIHAASCNTATNGSASIAVTGGHTPYSYSWSNGTVTQFLANVAPGFYMVTVTDAYGCSAATSVLIPADTTGLVKVVVDSVSKINCLADGTGIIYTHAINGTIPYTYTWNTGSIGATINGLSTGTYTVTVIDANNCLDRATANVQKATPPLITINSITSASCFGVSNGSAVITTLGGTAPYMYSWSNGTTSRNLVNAAAGTYSVTVTDAYNCSAQQTLAIIADTANAVHLVTDSVFNVNCISSASGKIYIHGIKGVAPYTFAWSNGATSASVSGLVVNTYSVTVTDASGCKDHSAYNILQATPPSVLLSSTQPAACSTAANGNINIFVSGGTQPYSYLWSNGAKTEDLSGIRAGNYSVTVTDAYLCQATQNVVVTVDTDNILALITDSVTQVNCNNPLSGRIYTHATKGRTPYLYLWSNGANTNNVTGLSVNVYSVIATDAAGCKDTATINLNVIDGPAILVTGTTAASCYTSIDGGVTVSTVDGTPPYTYLWTDGHTTASVSGVSAGSYSVTVTDSKGCKATQPITVAANIATSVSAIIDSTVKVLCSNPNSGGIYTHANMGKPPYAYAWSGGMNTPSVAGLAVGTYTVIVTDAVNCKDTAAVSLTKSTDPLVAIGGVVMSSCGTASDGRANALASGGRSPYAYLWSNGSTSASLTGVAAGSYSVTVTDAAECIANAGTSITADIANAIAISVDSTINANCKDDASGKIYVHAVKGKSPYTYMWSSGSITSAIVNLAAGTYSVMATDAAGCKDTATASISKTGGPSVAVSGITPTSCLAAANGKATANVSGGKAPYTYLWSDGSTNTNLVNAIVGSYSITVTDANGCMATQGVTILADTGNAVRIVTDSVINAGCANFASGKVYTHASKGLLPYTYLWSNGSSNSNLLGVVSGLYSIVVTDASGCKDTTSANVLNDGIAGISISTTGIKCYGDATGSISVHTAVPGNYAYKWNNGNITPEAFNLAAGIYSVNVSNTANGCVFTDTVILTAPDAIRLTTNVTDENCAGNNGSIAISAYGGVLPYIYLSNGVTVGSIVGNLLHGLYALSVVDQNGCIASATAEVKKSRCDTVINIHNVITPNGDGINDTWTIDGISAYPNASVQVFDKWGDVVFSSSHYNNDWNGTDNSHRKLAGGTYYYLLKLNGQNLSGGDNAFTGFIMVQQ